MHANTPASFHKHKLSILSLETERNRHREIEHTVKCSVWQKSCLTSLLEYVPPTLGAINIQSGSSATGADVVCQQMIRENSAGCVYVCSVRKRARGRSHRTEELRAQESAQNKHMGTCVRPLSLATGLKIWPFKACLSIPLIHAKLTNMHMFNTKPRGVNINT